MGQLRPPYINHFPDPLPELSDIILVGEEALSTCKMLVDAGRLFNTKKYPRPYISGYYLDSNKFVCFDNTTGDCWVEQTDSEELAKLWCQRKIEAECL